MSNPVPILRATPAEGKLKWRGRDGEAWLSAISRWNGKPVEITIQPERKRRSINQNSYYHGVVVKIMADAAGSEPEEMHHALAERFLRKLIAFPLFPHSEGLPTVKSTASLTTVEFEDYMRQCRQFGAEFFGVYIPDPNEVVEF